MIRSLRRSVAKERMKRASLHRICSHNGNRGWGSKKTLHTDLHSGNRSYFAAHWGEFV